MEEAFAKIEALEMIIIEITKALDKNSILPRHTLANEVERLSKALGKTEQTQVAVSKLSQKIRD